MRRNLEQRGTRVEPMFERLGRRQGSMGEPRREPRPTGNGWQSVSTPQIITRVANGFFLLAFVLGAYLLGSLAAQSRVAQFQIVKLQGELKRVNVAALEQRVRAWRGSFFTLDLGRARREVEKVPWVKSAVLERRWPGQLIIKLVEHQPFARWNDKELINTDGMLFKARFEGVLPRFAGPEDMLPRIVTRYHVVRDIVAVLGLKPVGIEVTARSAWRVKLDNSLTLELGRGDFEQRLATFVTAYREGLAQVAARDAVVDLRYNRGLALKIAAATPATAQPRKR